MTLQWIPLAQLQPHPDNSNRMPARLMEKLRRHIERTGLYEPLVVRPLDECGVRSAECEVEKERDKGAAGRRDEGTAAVAPFTPHSELRTPHCRYQILNGHHRAEVLRQLGHTHARCDVWNVSDEDALVLLATLNRLEGRDDPAARARLVAKMAGDRSPEDLARLLPEPADAVARLMKLATPPPAPLAPDDAALAQRPMTFFLTEEQHAAVTEALREAARAPDTTKPSRGGQSCPPREGEACAPYLAPGEYTGGDTAKEASSPCGPPCVHGGLNTANAPGVSRADALERLALWFLEARNLR